MKRTGKISRPEILMFAVLQVSYLSGKARMWLQLEPSFTNQSTSHQLLTVASFLSRFNIVDYKIWGTMQKRVYQTKVRDVDDLKRRLTEVWDSLEQSVIDNAIDQWRSRLNSCLCPCKRRTFWTLIVIVTAKTENICWHWLKTKILLFTVKIVVYRRKKITSFVQFIISQDIVATRSGWFVVKYNNHFVVNFILNSMLTIFENRSIFA